MNRILNIQGGFLSFLKFFSVSFIVLSLVFMPLLVIPVAQWDDYNFFARVPKEGSLSPHPQTPFMFYFGRHFQGLFGSFFMRFVDVPSDFAPIRMISIFFASVSAALFTVFFRMSNIGKLPTLFASIAIFLLPGVQFYILLVFASPMIIAVFMALSSALLLEKVEAMEFLKLRFTTRSLLLTICSFLLLLISIHTYPISTMFFLVPTLVLILFNDIDKWKETRLLVLRNLVLLSGVISIFFLVHRYITLPFLLNKYPQAAHVNKPGSIYQFALSTDIMKKITFFIKDLSFQSFNLWSIYPTRQVAFSILLFIIAGVAAALWKLTRRAALENHYRYISQASVAVSLLLILSNLPNLAATGGYPAYRTLFPYTAMIVILLVWSIKAISDILPEKWRIQAIWGATGFMLIISVFYANYNVLNAAVSNHLELSHLRQAVSAEIANKPPAIHVIKSVGDKSFLNLPIRHDEFNIYSTAFPLMVSSFLKTDGEDRDGIIKTDYFPFISNSWANEKVLYIPSGSIIVNMDALKFPLKNYSVKPINKYEIIYVDVSSAASGPYYSGGYIGTRAFDGSNEGGSFWETGSSGYPQWLRITYPQPRKLFRYELQTGELPERMIKAWTLQGSEDGNKWIDIDSRTDQTNWKTNKKRGYEVDRPANYKYYRFFITDGNAPILRVYEIKMIFQ
jgi:hypothetical protein